MTRLMPCVSRPRPSSTFQVLRRRSAHWQGSCPFVGGPGLRSEERLSWEPSPFDFLWLRCF